MANWKYTFNISDIWNLVEEGKMNTGAFADEVANRIEKQFFPKYEDDLYEIVSELRDVKHILDDEGLDGAQEVFNSIWSNFYDWADSSINNNTKMCWVKTL